MFLPLAYPHASKPTIGPTATIMRLSPHESSILVNLYPEYRDFIRDDGSMLVRLARALYGLIESAKLWYEELSSTLASSGFIPNEYDPCVLNKVVNNNQITICLHVDDMLITSINTDLIQQLHKDLEAKYGIMVLKEGLVHSFLGMSLDFRQEGKVIFTMGKFIDEILLKGNVQGFADTPAGENVFMVDESLLLLPPNEQEHLHSMTAMLLYLAKKIRPEFLTLTGFLTRRVNKYTIEDSKKLNRGLKYLASTKDLQYILCFDENLQIVSSVDASYASSHDFKSISGATTSLGGASIHAQSKVQSLVTKSSFEAELVATSDYAGTSTSSGMQLVISGIS
eukprot:gene11550-24161_t